MWWCLAVMLYLVTPILGTEDERNFVVTAQGPIRGYKETEDVYAFYSIPYATAPTGSDKFKAPLPPPNWTDTFEAVDKGIICPQPDFGTEIFVKKRTMQENCLILNIYVPDTEENNLSVVVFIHGGAFQVGAGNRREALSLMQSKRIITVTFNYRLGVIGFLCLGTKDVPGNAGMKDIIAMLRWLKKNISSFGGNPYDVTVSGYSSGAVAADLLILSKSAMGLFNKVIIESGSNLAEFAIQLKPLDIAKTYARTLNFTNVDDIFFLEKFYKSLLYHKFTEEAFVYRKDSSFVFVPCVERDVGEEMFLHDTPMNILKSGDFIKVPMLYGFTNMEGLVRLPFFDLLKSAMNQNFTDYLPPDLKFDSDQEREHITKKVKEFYFTEKPIDDNSVLAYVDYITDVMFASPALRSVSLNVAAGNRQIYLYYYSFTDENDPYVAHTTVRGANHCAQSLAVFDDVEPKNVTTKFTILRKIIRKMWYGFITTGEPIPKKWSLPMTWPPTSVNRTPYMSFGEFVKLGDILLEKRARFWDNIYGIYYRQAEPPPLQYTNATLKILL